MTQPTPEVEEFEKKFCRRAPQDNTTLQEIERWYSARDWVEETLTTLTTKHQADIEKAVEGERERIVEVLMPIPKQFFLTDLKVNDSTLKKSDCIRAAITPTKTDKTTEV